MKKITVKDIVEVVTTNPHKKNIFNHYFSRQAGISQPVPICVIGHVIVHNGGTHKDVVESDFPSRWKFASKNSYKLADRLQSYADLGKPWGLALEQAKHDEGYLESR